MIIPVYNVEKFIPECLESCVNQSFANVEFICVNDGSTDHSGELIENISAEDSRFVVINQINKGVSSARNAGLKAARGELIMFLDPDDVLSLSACETV